MLMGAVLKEKELLPQKILASSAVRIRETIDGMAQVGAFTDEIEFSDELYLAEPEIFLKFLANLPEPLERVMLMGHNPGLEGLLQVLSGRIESLPTGSVAFLSLPIQQWSEINNGTEGELIEMLLPREMREMRELEEEKQKEKDKKDKKDKKESKKDDKKEDKKDDKKEDKKDEKKEDKKEDKKEEKKAEKKETGKEKKEGKKK